MKLSVIEREQALWKKIERTVSERLQIMREKNDNQLDPLETATIRGQIKFAKEVLSWAKDDPQITGDL